MNSEVQLVFFLLFVTLVSDLRNRCQSPRQGGLLFGFLLRTLVLVLMFRSLIHVELIFTYGLRLP